MENSKKKIKGDWENLIILDACRYDFFEESYQKFFEGKLEKVISPASNTEEFCKKILDKVDLKDVVYVSANPFINSYESVKGFNAKESFKHISNVWSDGWNKELGTVPPEKVNESVRKVKKKYPDSRLIIHYLQPHIPYITEGGKFKGREEKKDIKSSDSKVGRKMKELLGKSKIKELAKIFLKGPFKRIIKRRNYWKFMEFLGREVDHPMYQILKEKGKEGLREAYQNDLELVLEKVKEIYPILKGKTIITADHGELLGEDNDYEHYPKKRKKKLIEVPWFEIKKEKN